MSKTLLVLRESKIKKTLFSLLDKKKKIIKSEVVKNEINESYSLVMLSEFTFFYIYNVQIFNF